MVAGDTSLLKEENEGNTRMWIEKLWAGTELSVPALLTADTMINEKSIWILSAAAMIIFAAASIFIIARGRRNRVSPMDEMEGHEFEYYCAELLERNGFTEVEVTKGSGDFGADILARKEDITYAFQCKCYTSPVGVAAIQEVYAGKDYYDRMVGVVMTNQYFTSPAVKLAEKLKVILWDRGYIETMAEEI